MLHEIKAFDPKLGVHTIVAHGIGTGLRGEKDVTRLFDKFLKEAIEAVTVNLTAGTGHGRPYPSLGMLPKGFENEGKVLGAKFNLKRNRCITMVFENRKDPFDHPFCLRLAVIDFLFDLW